MISEEIDKRCKEKNLSITALEQKAGLSINSVRNILNGRIKKPSVSSISAIANALGCSLLDLINGSDSKDLEPKMGNEKHIIIEDFNLMEDCCEAVINLLKKREELISLSDCFNLISIVYSYTRDDKSRNVDHKFVKWMIEQR
jgi:transcriptional regulator with XRE-family HTH domain